MADMLLDTQYYNVNDPRAYDYGGWSLDALRNVKAEVKPGEDPPISDEVRESLRAYLPAAGMAPRVVVKFVEEKELLVSGMLSGGRELAGKPVVVDVPRGKGHVLMFANNPMWRDETQGSYFLLAGYVLDSPGHNM